MTGRVSMADVARLAGVSKNTVSLALRGSPLVTGATREAVERAAEQLGYRRNAVVGCLMAELRRTGAERFQALLGLLNANEDPQAFRRHPTLPRYVDGCLRRAQRLGYGLDEFWLHDPEVDGRRLVSILRARGVKGLVVVGLMKGNRLPARMAEVWEEFPAVVTGVRTRGPSLSFACADHHGLALLAYEKAVAMGYRRPGLVLDPVIDELIEGRFTAGYLTGQLRLSRPADRVKPFMAIEDARRDLRVFGEWLEKWRPDVVFTLYHEVARWLAALGVKGGEDIGLIQYEWRADHAEWAGMDQRNDLAGEAAVDMLVSMVQHGEKGPPACPLATLVSSQWVDGLTAPGVVVVT